MKWKHLIGSVPCYMKLQELLLPPPPPAHLYDVFKTQRAKHLNSCPYNFFCLFWFVFSLFTLPFFNSQSCGQHFIHGWQATKPRDKHGNIIGKESINQKDVLVWPRLLLKTSLMAESLKQEANLVISLSAGQTVVACVHYAYVCRPRLSPGSAFSTFLSFFLLLLCFSKTFANSKKPAPFGIHIKVRLRLRD